MEHTYEYRQLKAESVPPWHNCLGCGNPLNDGSGRELTCKQDHFRQGKTTGLAFYYYHSDCLKDKERQE